MGVEDRLEALEKDNKSLNWNLNFLKIMFIFSLAFTLLTVLILIDVLSDVSSLLISINNLHESLMLLVKTVHGE